jgi:hypothetical protein
MENRQTIQEELAEISSVVAAIDRAEVYTVPGGYFDGLAFAVLLKMALDEKAGTDPVVPGNGVHPYQVPQGYFNGFAAVVMQRIREEAAAEAALEDPVSPLLASIGRKHPYTPPPGYFDELSLNVMTGAQALDMVNEQLENLSPAIRSVQQKNPYSVPDGYFEQLPAAILLKAASSPTTPVLSLAPRKTNLRKYAVAAAVAGVIALSGYLFSGSKTGASLATANRNTLIDTAALAKIPDPEIENFLHINTIALAEIASDSLSTAKLAGHIADDPKDLLADISDEALESYIDQRPETPVAN